MQKDLSGLKKKSGQSNGWKENLNQRKKKIKKKAKPEEEDKPNHT